MAAQDLQEQIDWSQTQCLNAKPSKPVTNALKQGYREDDGLLVESDTDEQLLIHIAFQGAVRLNALVIKAEGGDHAPRHVKLFSNRPSMGFQEAEGEAAVQEFDLEEQQLAGAQVLLRFVKFQSVNVLSIFIGSNQGEEDSTHVSCIKLFGSPKEGFNVADIKKVGEEGGPQPQEIANGP